MSLVIIQNEVRVSTKEGNCLFDIYMVGNVTQSFLKPTPLRNTHGFLCSLQGFFGCVNVGGIGC